MNFNHKSFIYVEELVHQMAVIFEKNCNWEIKTISICNFLQNWNNFSLLNFF